MKRTILFVCFFIGMIAFAITAQVVSHMVTFESKMGALSTMSSLYALSIASATGAVIVACIQAHVVARKEFEGKSLSWSEASDSYDYRILSFWMHEGVVGTISVMDPHDDIITFSTMTFPLVDENKEKFTGTLTEDMMVRKISLRFQICIQVFSSTVDPLPVPEIKDDSGVLGGGDPTPNAPSEPEAS